MKNLKFIPVVILAGIFLVACSASNGGDPDKSAEKIIQEGIDNMSQVKSASYEISVIGEFENVETVGDFELTSVEANFSGQYDFNDLKNSKLSILIELIASLNNGSDENIDGEIRIIDNNMYFIITEVPYLQGQLPTELIEPFLSKWWSMTVPEEELEQALELYYAEQDDSNLTEEQKKVQTLLKETFMFKDVEFQGIEKVKGTKSYYYKANLDTNSIKEYFLKSAEIYGQTVPDYQLKQIDDFLNNLDISLGLWISQDNNILIKFYADAIINEPDIAKLHLKVSSTLSDLNEKVELDAPEDATMIDPLALMMGAAALIPEDELYGDDIIFEDFADLSY